MAGVSHLDEIVDFKRAIINALASSPDVVGLLLDDPNVDMESDEAYAVREENIFDYDYVDETQTTAKSYVMVEVEVPSSGGTMKDLVIYVQVVVHKSLMTLDTTKFKGVKGNRKDNLIRQIDLLLNNSREFGIGKLLPESVTLARVPVRFSSTMLTYSCPNFSIDRKLVHRG